ncbi:unnamed protein product, partial [marine sediment metagenome]
LETGKLELQSNGRVDVDGLEKIGVGRINKLIDIYLEGGRVWEIC